MESQFRECADDIVYSFFSFLCTPNKPALPEKLRMA